MSKYSYEFKKKIVKDYLSGKGGYRFLAQQYGIPDKKQSNRQISSRIETNTTLVRKYE